MSQISSKAFQLSIGGAVTNGTSGSVLFIDSSGNLAQSNSNFFWDNTNKRLGIGTSSPSKALDILTGSINITNNLDNTDVVGLTFNNSGSGTSTGAKIQFPYNNISAKYNGFTITNSGSATDSLSIGLNTFQYSGNNFQFASGINADVTFFSGASSGFKMIFQSPGDIKFNTYSGGFSDKMIVTQAGQLLLTGFSASTIGQVIKGAALQSGNLQEWQNSSGAVLVAITSAGYLGIGISSSLSAPLHVKATSQAVYVGDNASTSTVYCQFQNAGGRFYAGVDNSTGTGLWTGGIAYASSFGTGNSTAFQIATNNTVRLSLAANGSSLTYSDAVNIAVGTTTGTKIGTATSQKISLWNATPIVQPTTAGAASTFVVNTSGIANDTATFDGYTIGQVVKALRNIGALA